MTAGGGRGPTCGDDERGASVQVGVVVLFGFIVVAMAVWQATVVPQQNQRVEYTHHQQAVGDLQGARDSIVSAPGSETLSSVTVDMAPEYPPRTVFVNPGRPSGTLRTVGTADSRVNLTVANAVALDDATADAWNGSARTYSTGGLLYDPGYNVYTSAPTTVYENTVLYNRRGGGENVTLAGQDLVDGRTLTLVTMAGNLSRTESGSYSLDPSALSSSTRTVAVTNATGNVTVSVASRQPAAWWTERLRTELLANGGNVVDVRSTPLSDGFHNVTLELAGNRTYRLRMARVGVGSGASRPGADYLTDVVGDGTSVGEAGMQRVVVEVRDRYNNPVSGVTVRGRVGTGGLDAGRATTDDAGRAVFTYEAPADVDGGPDTARVNLSFTGVPGAGFDAGAPGNVSVTVSVRNTDGSGTGGGGGGGGYDVTWDGPDVLGANGGEAVSCTDGDCTWDAGSGDGVLVLQASNPEGLQGVNVDFASNDSGVALLTPGEAETDAGGAARTKLYATANGTVAVHAAVTGDREVLNVTVTNVSGGGSNVGPSASFTASPSDPSTADTVSFDAGGSADPDGSVVSYEWSFGDGTTSTGVAPDHTYADDGTYTVTLTVTDDDGATDSTNRTVSVANEGPTASFTADCSGDTCEFDAGGSADPDGSVAAYDWEFGDGSTSTGVTATHEYASGGTYTVTLTVTDDDGATDSATTTVSVTANDRPSASLSVTCDGRTCEFDAGNSTDPDGSVVEYRWDFDGDGVVDDTTTTATVDYTFADNGTYTATVTVEDDGRATDDASATFYATDPPTAAYEWRCRGLACTLDASAASDPDGSVVTYEWDVDDDGTYELTASDPVSTTRFGGDGTYPVTLRVTDDDGATGTLTADLVAYEPRYPGDYTTNEGSVSDPANLADGDASTAATFSEGPSWCVYGSYTGCRLDVDTTTTDVPVNRSGYTLAIRYETAGDSEPFTVTVYDGGGSIVKTVSLNPSSDPTWRNVSIPASAVTSELVVNYEDTLDDSTITDLQVYTQRLVVNTTGDATPSLSRVTAAPPAGTSTSVGAASGSSTGGSPGPRALDPLRGGRLRPAVAAVVRRPT